jgi:predicted kinase
MGVAGSGKTTLARGIAARIWTVYLDNNHIADPFFPETRNGRAYEKLRPHFYQVLYTVARENLRLGNSVLLDVPHIKEVQSRAWRRSMQRLAGSTGARLIAIRCLCSPNILRRRIEQRDEPRDRWKLKHWREFLVSQPVAVSIPFAHLDVNTETGLPKNISTAVRYVLNRAKSD